MKEIDYAFIVHSRNRNDLSRKYPFLRYIPRRLFDWITFNLPPFVVSKITGLKYLHKDGYLRGVIIGIPMTAHQLLEHRGKALDRIIQAVGLSKKMGAKHVGLGAMTASLSRSGLDVADKVQGVYVTTGRTYTVKNITDYVEFCVSRFNLNKQTLKVGILGAAGGIGSGVAISLAVKQYKNFVLIDLERKLDHLKKRIEVLESHAKDLTIKLSHKVPDISESSIIIAATSSPEIVLKSEDINPGTIIINDAQPSDISPEIIRNRPDVLVIEGGVLHTDNIDCHFNLGLAHKHDIFSCLGETILLASIDSVGHHSVGDFDLILYNKLADVATKLGFSSCLQNETGILDENRISSFMKILRK